MYAKLEQQASAAAQVASVSTTGASAPVNRDIRQALKSEEDKQRHRDIIARVREWLEGDTARAGEQEGPPEVVSKDRPAAVSEGMIEPVSDRGEVSSGAAPGDGREKRDGARQEGLPGANPDVFVFEPMNSFWRAVVYQTLEREFGKGRFLIEKVPVSCKHRLRVGHFQVQRPAAPAPILCTVLTVFVYQS